MSNNHTADAKSIALMSEVCLEPHRKGRLYLAGPMSGIEDHNFPKFNRIAGILTRCGWTVLNPADHGVVPHARWADYLRYDLGLLCTCEAAFFMDGWHQSRGAHLEHMVCAQLGLDIYYENGSTYPVREGKNDALS